MGRGNVCVTGAYEGLYYIDNDDFHVYRRDDPNSDDELETRLLRDLSYQELTGGEWLFCEPETEGEKDDILKCFIEGFTRGFPSFRRPESTELWLKDARVILESKLFHIAVEDNQWSLAVKLLQKEEPWGNVWMENLQKRLHEKYLDGMKRCLLEVLPSIKTYKGVWQSSIIRGEKTRWWVDARRYCQSNVRSKNCHH